MADDLYSTLGVTKNASEEDIRRAFRKLAKELHPDIAKGTEERFKKVSSAYEILGDPDKRRAYDRGEIDGHGDPRHPGFRQYARGPTSSPRGTTCATPSRWIFLRRCRATPSA
jgi:DnaJ-class molecular chaperone